MDKHRQSILTDVRYLLDNPRAPVYIIDGIIEENSTGAVIGASGSEEDILGS